MIFPGWQNTGMRRKNYLVDFVERANGDRKGACRMSGIPEPIVRVVEKVQPVSTAD
ncbi:MAG: hypothetical protein R2874_17580 [Desulfobacterales bacterium]